MGPSPARRVLVTGAAGVVGRGVLRRLAHLGVPVTALVRDDPGDLATGHGPGAERTTVDRVVVGLAHDPASVRSALHGVDAVVHLAALASPEEGTPHDVFTNNTAATFTVLEESGAAGVSTVAVAGSINALGLRFAPGPVAPPYLPVDAESPTLAADPYAMSKWSDEATARAMHRRHGTTVTVVRLPMVGGLGDVAGLDDRLAVFLREPAHDPGAVARDLWSYLETRDAARALVLALTPREPGAHVLFAAAPTTSVPYRTADLVARWWAGVEVRRPLPGRTVPIDLGPARTVLGFAARHVVDLPELPLPQTDARRS
ncbi:NAD-dependent epimerase/dehydratase family protein [Luteimicrobium subarcticum]|uniref:Nucleoside-diphosphate-sugar epimerase n=1 Tax=Luteimicrobium subarcticum TaxID=620910 RepID=A0A2M8WW62_9MICO|nr:NAD(P)-dependent oxidoreductase [Luteimicrobium subarcticum]PJI95157.1 nucleoside-diphosphate-sugar epimerase [Luteimicrobium subarcticum]